MSQQNNAPSQDITTRLIHHAYEPPAGFAAPQPAIHKASTVLFPDVAALRAREWKDKTSYTYGLHGTPTTYRLEERIATLEGGQQCLLAPSGLAAISTVALALRTFQRFATQGGDVVARLQAEDAEDGTHGGVLDQ